MLFAGIQPYSYQYSIDSCVSMTEKESYTTRNKDAKTQCLFDQSEYVHHASPLFCDSSSLLFSAEGKSSAAESSW